MYEDRAAEQLCYSGRLLQPFLQLLLRQPGFPADAIMRLRALGPDERIAIGKAHLLLEAAVLWTRDPALGLKAGRLMESGDGGAVEYAASTAATVGEALEVVVRYGRLISDTVDLRLELEGARAILRADTRVVLPRTVADFLASALQSGYLRMPSNGVAAPQWWFPYPEPADVGEHERTFAPGSLRFSAPWLGVVLERKLLEAKLATADPKLHTVLRKHVESMLVGLPKALSATERVRDLIAQELPHGDPSVARVARVLHVSPRTLGRRLSEEGTTFSELLDDLRRRLALRYVTTQTLGLSEVAFLLGFSDVAAFYRAFKRWTGRTPLEYRRSAQRN